MCHVLQKDKNPLIVLTLLDTETAGLRHTLLPPMGFLLKSVRSKSLDCCTTARKERQMFNGRDFFKHFIYATPVTKFFQNVLSAISCACKVNASVIYKISNLHQTEQIFMILTKKFFTSWMFIFLFIRYSSNSRKRDK